MLNEIKAHYDRTVFHKLLRNQRVIKFARKYPVRIEQKSKSIFQVNGMYRNLNPDKTLETIQILQKRIKERFPSSGLSRVCAEFYHVAEESKNRALNISNPNYTLRAAVGLSMIVILAALLYLVFMMDVKIHTLDLGELVQITEAGLNVVLLIGGSIIFLVTAEIRIKRSRTLDALHELRTIAHVIDMHQLTKDPGKMHKNVIHTASSPKQILNEYELMRYLDYCSEMLSLIGKVAALYAQNFKDSVVISSVNEIENLTTDLSRKIWQKIMILHKLQEA
ncbi:MAG: hypothetical protein OEZ34_14165 [Spirochaetia bacterium]|nr:hypothetical protein [Spirochaetia bacterium]